MCLCLLQHFFVCSELLQLLYASMPCAASAVAAVSHLSGGVGGASVSRGHSSSHSVVTATTNRGMHCDMQVTSKDTRLAELQAQLSASAAQVSQLEHDMQTAQQQQQQQQQQVKPAQPAQPPKPRRQQQQQQQVVEEQQQQQEVDEDEESQGVEEAVGAIGRLVAELDQGTETSSVGADDDSDADYQEPALAKGRAKWVELPEPSHLRVVPLYLLMPNSVSQQTQPLAILSGLPIVYRAPLCMFGWSAVRSMTAAQILCIMVACAYRSPVFEKRWHHSTS